MTIRLIWESIWDIGTKRCHFIYRVPEESPIFYSWNEEPGKMCFESKNEHPYESFDDLHLNYRLCGMQNAREMHLYSGSNLLLCIFGSERPIQKKMVSADTDNRPLLPILSADNCARNRLNLPLLFSEIGQKVMTIIWNFCWAKFHTNLWFKFQLLYVIQ